MAKDNPPAANPRDEVDNSFWDDEDEALLRESELDWRDPDEEREPQGCIACGGSGCPACDPLPEDCGRP